MHVHAQVVTGAINMLNMALCQPDLTVRARAALSEERSLIPALMALLDHPLPVLRAKAIVTIMLLCTRCVHVYIRVCAPLPVRRHACCASVLDHPCAQQPTSTGGLKFAHAAYTVLLDACGLSTRCLLGACKFLNVPESMGACRLSTRWLLDACKSKLIPVVERLQREKDDYLQEAIGVMRAELTRLVPLICQQVCGGKGGKGGKFVCAEVTRLVPLVCQQAYLLMLGKGLVQSSSAVARKRWPCKLGECNPQMPHLESPKSPECPFFSGGCLCRPPGDAAASPAQHANHLPTYDCLVLAIVPHR
eukprot:1155283-Pelagomonas_calceolata.AAC.2